MKKSLIVALAAVLGWIAVPAQAQERSMTMSLSNYDREVSVTYSALRDVRHMGSGFLVDFGKGLKTTESLQVSAVGEFAMNHFTAWTGETYKNLNGGVRLGTIASKARPFGQVMVGLQRDFGVNAFNFQPGGGINLRVGSTTDIKVQLDFPIVRWLGDTYKQVRFSAGVGLPLGR